MNSNKNKLNSEIIYNFHYFTNLFLLLFIGPTALFGTIHRPHYAILVNFYLYLQYFQQNKRIPNKPLMCNFQNVEFLG